MNWNQVNQSLSRNWREKCLALLIAFLCWVMIKGQSGRSPWQQSPRGALREAFSLPSSSAK